LRLPSEKGLFTHEFMICLLGRTLAGCRTLSDFLPSLRGAKRRGNPSDRIHAWTASTDKSGSQ
jgi:hypothetical protein